MYIQEPSIQSSLCLGDLVNTDKEDEEAAAAVSSGLDSKDPMLLLLEG